MPRDGNTDAVYIARPPTARCHDPSGHAPIGLGEGVGFGFAVSPKGSEKTTHAARPVLFYRNPNAELFLRAVANRVERRGATGYRCAAQRILVAGHSSPIPHPEQTNGASKLGRKIAPFDFDLIAKVPEDLGVEGKLIGPLWLSEASKTQGPCIPVKFRHPTPRVASSVGSVVIRCVSHEGPVEKVRTRVVGKAVVVEKVEDGQVAHRKYHPTRGRPQRKLIFAFLFPLSGFGEEPELLEEKSGAVRGQTWPSRSRDFSVREAAQTRKPR